MSKPLLGNKIAILIANGFCEQDMTEAQRALTEAGANVRIVSPEQGLVNGWTGEAWGHHFAVDALLSTALGADFNMLLIPGGQRSHDKLKLTAHTRRFIASFMAARKPVALFGDAVNLMAATDTARGYTLAGPAQTQAAVAGTGGEWSADMPCQDRHLISGDVTRDNRADYIRAVVGMFAGQLQPEANKAA